MASFICTKKFTPKCESKAIDGVQFFYLNSLGIQVKKIGNLSHKEQWSLDHAILISLHYLQIMCASKLVFKQDFFGCA